MLATSLINGIIKRGGEAALVTETLTDHFTGETRERSEVVGTLNGHDVHAYCDSFGKTDAFGHFTTRKISQRGYFDPCADYNSGGYTFCDRIKDLDWATKSYAAA